MRHIALLWVLGTLPWADLSAQHKTRTAEFRVAAHVETACEVAAPDIALGTRTAQGGIKLQITATCTPNLTYDIRLNEARSPGADSVIGTGTGSSEDHTIFGSLPATEVVPASEYVDVITVRVYH